MNSISIIKSKNEAEILLMVLMKYYNGIEISTRLFRMMVSWSDKSLKPFRVTIHKKNNGDELITFETFRKTIDWIYDNRMVLNDFISYRNKNGWIKNVYNPVGNYGGLY